MEYNYNLNPTNKTIVVTTGINFTSYGAAEMDIFIRKTAKNLSYSIVFDYRASNDFLSFGEAYFWFSNYFNEADFELRSIPTVLIANQTDIDKFNFFETVCYNNNIKLKVFLDIESSLPWIEEHTQIGNQNN